MKTALIIEDNLDNMVLITRFLEKFGYRTIQARTGQQGFEMALTKRPDFIILDIQLPDIEGTEVLKMIRGSKIGSSIPIIAMTSYAMAGDLEKLLAAGCDGYIEKPIDPERIISQIRRVVSSRRPSYPSRMQSNHDGYWEGRWKRGETGWHQAEAEPRMVAYFSGLAPARVLVPLCGKSLDMKWLRDHGHEVVGIELAEQPCREFFHDHSIPLRESREGAFKVFRGDHVTILNGDFFALEPRLLGPIGAVYDRAALIALPPEFRARYSEQMLRLTAKSNRSDPFHFLQIVLERTPHDEQGPPFSVRRPEVENLYAAHFEVKPLSRERVTQGPPTPGITEECVYELRPL